jgi:hypothetical protein
MYDGSNPNWVSYVKSKGRHRSKSYKYKYYEILDEMAALPAFFSPVYSHVDSTIYSRPYPYWDVEKCSVRQLRELSDRMKTSDKAGTNSNNAVIYIIFMLCFTLVSQVGIGILEGTVLEG